MTTIGFGDFYPSTLFGRIIGSAIAIWGCFVFAFLANSFVLSSKFTEQEESVFKSLRNEKIRATIIKKVLQQPEESTANSKNTTMLGCHSQDSNLQSDYEDKERGWQKVRRVVKKIRSSLRCMNNVSGRRKQLIQEIYPKSNDTKIIKMRETLLKKIKDHE
jgi:hypothetical protein